MRQVSTEAKDGDGDKGDLGTKMGTGFGATNLTQTNRDLAFFC
jgi:hypothetical protein